MGRGESSPPHPGQGRPRLNQEQVHAFIETRCERPALRSRHRGGRQSLGGEPLADGGDGRHHDLRRHPDPAALDADKYDIGHTRAAQEAKDKLFAEVSFSSALSQLNQAWTDIQTAKPFAVCPTCQGQLPDNCTLCRGRGLVSEYRWNTCVTSEDKAFRAKVRASRRQPAVGQK